MEGDESLCVVSAFLLSAEEQSNFGACAILGEAILDHGCLVDGELSLLRTCGWAKSSSSCTLAFLIDDFSTLLAGQGALPVGSPDHVLNKEACELGMAGL